MLESIQSEPPWRISHMYPMSGWPNMAKDSEEKIGGYLMII